ncbi:hypothetical protein GCM10023067_26690 [Aminobacter aganoensis]
MHIGTFLLLRDVSVRSVVPCPSSACPRTFFSVNGAKEAGRDSGASLPLVGRVRVGVDDGRNGSVRGKAVTPTPSPSPQGGGESLPLRFRRHLHGKPGQHRAHQPALDGYPAGIAG